MTDQEARMFVEALAVPAPTVPATCPMCAGRHDLELPCDSGRARLQNDLWADDEDAGDDPLVSPRRG
jgi:hypothetical protein